MESRLYVYFALIFILFFLFFAIRRIRYARRAIAARSANVQEQIYHDSRGNEYTVYTIPHNGTTWQTQPQPQFQSEVHQHSPNDDLPPKYEDLVYQQPASTTVASGDTNNSPPRYIM